MQKCPTNRLRASRGSQNQHRRRYFDLKNFGTYKKYSGTVCRARRVLDLAPLQEAHADLAVHVVARSQRGGKTQRGILEGLLRQHDPGRLPDGPQDGAQPHDGRARADRVVALPRVAHRAAARAERRAARRGGLHRAARGGWREGRTRPQSWVWRYRQIIER